MSANPTLVTSRTPAAPRLLDQLRLTAWQRGHGEPAVAAFADWSQRFILFHGNRHPRERGLPEVGQFLDSIARTEKDPVRAIASSRDAVDFLYREVLHGIIGNNWCQGIIGVSSFFRPFQGGKMN